MAVLVPPVVSVPAPRATFPPRRAATGKRGRSFRWCRSRPARHSQHPSRRSVTAEVSAIALPPSRLRVPALIVVVPV